MFQDNTGGILLTLIVLNKFTFAGSGIFNSTPGNDYVIHVKDGVLEVSN